MFAAGCLRFLRVRYSDDHGLYRAYAEWILALLPEDDVIRQVIAHRMSAEDDGAVCELVLAGWESETARLGVLPRLLRLLSDRLREFNDSTKRGEQ